MVLGSARWTPIKGLSTKPHIFISLVGSLNKMGDKKRKGMFWCMILCATKFTKLVPATPVSTDLPAKKTKKSKTGTDGDISKTQLTKHAGSSDKSPNTQETLVVSKKKRKHAVDFISDDEATPMSSKPSSEPKQIKPSIPVEVDALPVSDLKKKRKNKKSKKEEQGLRSEVIRTGQKKMKAYDAK